MSGLPPSDLVLNVSMGAKAANQWARILREGSMSPTGSDVRFTDRTTSLSIRYPFSAPSGYHDRRDAASSAARCLDVAAATRHTPVETMRRINDALLDVACHAWTLTDPDDIDVPVDYVTAMTATPWCEAIVLAMSGRTGTDITPTGWRETCPRIAMVGLTRNGPMGWYVGPPNAGLDVSGLDAMTTLRRSAAGAAACTPGFRWTMRGDEVWRKPSDERRVRR